MTKIQGYTIRFQGQLIESGQRVERKRRFYAASSTEALIAAHDFFKPWVEKCYFPTFITGDPAKLDANSVSARVIKRAGPEEA